MAKYDGLLYIPATDGNFISGIQHLKDSELGKMFDKLVELEGTEGGHKVRIKAVEKELKARSETSGEVRAVAMMADEIQTVDELYGDGMPYELDRIENEVRFYKNQAGTALVEIGKRLVRIKAYEGHGDYLKSLENLDMAPRSAQYAMLAARKFSNAPTLAHLESSKMKALTVLDEKDIETLENGGTAKGMTLDDIDRMTMRELRENLRKEKETVKKEKEARKNEREAFKRSMIQKDEKINDLDMKMSGREPPTKERIAEAALEELRKKLFAEIQLTRFHFGECLKVIETAEKIEGVTFPILEKWAKEEYAELAGFQPMLEELDESLRYVNPDTGGSEGNAD